jgi:hypothetical protein
LDFFIARSAQEEEKTRLLLELVGAVQETTGLIEARSVRVEIFMLQS